MNWDRMLNKNKKVLKLNNYVFIYIIIFLNVNINVKKFNK